MRNEFRRRLKIYIGMLFMLSACAGLQQQVTVDSIEGDKTITMEVGSFKFTPNNIKAYQGDKVAINIVNVSDAGHNFTLEDPQGQIIRSVDLPSKQTVKVRVTLTEAGEYVFYCDKPFHSSFGMKGQIEAVKK
ncbi:MAG: cupredoxin domain-containing protein [Dissulfurispiraceae bacterium]|jgi:plastocyanin